MKTFLIILKILAVLLAIAGIVFLVATYGDKIVAWFKKILRKTKPIYSNKRDFDCDCVDEGAAGVEADFEE